MQYRQLPNKAVSWKREKLNSIYRHMSAAPLFYFRRYSITLGPLLRHIIPQVLILLFRHVDIVIRSFSQEQSSVWTNAL